MAYATPIIDFTPVVITFLKFAIPVIIIGIAVRVIIESLRKKK